MKTLRLLLCSLLLAGGLSVTATAQEATAGATFNNDNSRLGNRVEVLRAMTESAGESISKVIACNNANQIYDGNLGGCKNIQPQDILACAKDGKLWDGVSCVDPRLTADLEKMLACQKQGLFYDGEKCITGPVLDSMLAKLENHEGRLTKAEQDLANMLACHRAGLLWIGTACREANIQALNDSLNCQRAGYVYAAAGSCRTTVVPAQSTGFSRFTYYGSAAYSSNSVVTSGWHTLCVLAFNHNDSNFWLNVIAGPNAQGKSMFQGVRGAGGAEPRILCMD